MERVILGLSLMGEHLGEAVDKVRRREHRELLSVGDRTLAGTKFHWLTNPENMSREKWMGFKLLRESALKTARAWALKETAMSLWHYISRGWAERAWQGWLHWAGHSRQEPMKKVVAMIREHLWGILNAIVLKVHNGGAESINSRIQLVKFRARGFRNRQRFINAIYFHLGGLDLYPVSAAYPSTHTDR